MLFEPLKFEVGFSLVFVVCGPVDAAETGATEVAVVGWAELAIEETERVFLVGL